MAETILDYGDHALLLQFGSTAEVLAWTEALREADLLGVVDIVPASRTVLVKLDGPRHHAITCARLRRLRVSADAVQTSLPDGQVDVVIDVVYDGVGECSCGAECHDRCDCCDQDSLPCHVSSFQG